jgi:hypothetical protein
MASIGNLFLTITRVPSTANVAVNVSYDLAGDAFDVALQTPYREICQLIGDDTPGDGTDDLLRTIRDGLIFFPDPATSNPVLHRSFDRILPLRALDEDNQAPFFEDDEIRAKVTLIALVPNFRESNVVRIESGPVVGQRAQSGAGAAESI